MNRSGSYETKQETAPSITANTWVYVVFSFRLVNGKDTEVTFWAGATVTGTQTFTTATVHDSANFDTVLGIERTGSETYANNWNGYIHDFAVWQKVMTSSTADNTLRNSGCAASPGTASSDCWTVDSLEWVDINGET
jgi:hypothetical protein